ncbi:hypothetical protein CTheo_5862 [Ceratobasidium theobromae]|uniref:Uncharacterized protein n=1 Tax=Ceratobasidium theobromae TaxID=1582974 RepID=A0A5N5QGV6_9AGAM|nr:hypothetical protein CTheo_5862 [Ceratobasidium theobromae]
MAPRIQLPMSEKPKPMLTRARIGIALAVSLITLAVLTPVHYNPLRKSSIFAMASPTGWHSRSTPHQDGPAYDIRKENLVLGMARNSKVEPEGFSVAFFKPNVAVDAMGRVLVVPESDWTAIVNLATQTLSLPTTGEWMNQWRVKHDRTCYPIDQLCVAKPDGRLHVISVYGHDGQTTQLQPPVHGRNNLPDSINTLISYAKEGREGFELGEENTQVTDRIKPILSEALFGDDA